MFLKRGEGVESRHCRLVRVPSSQPSVARCHKRGEGVEPSYSAGRSRHVRLVRAQPPSEVEQARCCSPYAFCGACLAALQPVLFASLFFVKEKASAGRSMTVLAPPHTFSFFSKKKSCTKRKNWPAFLS